MDIFEEASELEDKHRNLAIKAQRAMNKKMPFTGFCLFCGEPIKIGRFCSGGECKEDHEREQKMKRISGYE